uniref:Pectinesterase n=1 Tax=Kalanchoe fedtschenkoi TaxID=63787 RepID=A0A7N0RJU1_KALFE
MYFSAQCLSLSSLRHKKPCPTEAEYVIHIANFLLIITHHFSFISNPSETRSFLHCESMSVMDTVKSFKGYGKVDEVDNQQFRNQARKRWIIIGVSSLVLIAVVIAAVGAVVVKNRSSSSRSVPSSTTDPSAQIKAVCNLTMYPDSCYSSLLQATHNSSNNGDISNPLYLSKLAIQVALSELNKLSGYTSRYVSEGMDNRTKAALDDCESLFEDAIDRMNDSVSTMDTSGGDGILLSGSDADDLKTWLSSTITDLETCVDGLDESNFTLIDEVKSYLNTSSQLASNSLAIVTKISKLVSTITNQNRKLLEASADEFPKWMRPGVRRLLQTDVNPKPNVTVAKDGSGNFTTLKEAVALIPKKGKTRFVIYVKAGKYVENIVLDKSRWNVMIYGDGKTKTIISGSLNFVDGTPTFATATFAAVGKGFFAKDIRFENTAGAAKHQAVAFRSGADESVFYRCSFDAFQDTLYPHSNRQFYRDCDVTGTIDFIFGNAAVVFQNCLIQPRQPLPNQFVTITAQGKKDPNQNTGISIQSCTLSPLDNLTAPTYLGRPWKDYSTTVIMQSVIGSFLRPAGWIAWVSGVVPPSTINYAEYQNTGPGASTAGRVTWPGYRSSITAADASKFTVGAFIRGSEWLPATNVAFQASLTA